MPSFSAQPSPLAISRLSNGLLFSSTSGIHPGHRSASPSSSSGPQALSTQAVMESSTYAFFNHLIEQTTTNARKPSRPITTDLHKPQTEVYPNPPVILDAPDLHLNDDEDHEPPTAPPPPSKSPIPTGAIYRSLIPQILPEGDARPRRVRTSRPVSRQISSASSIRSCRSTISSVFSLKSNASICTTTTRRRRLVLLDLPVELIDDILANLDQPSLLNLLQVCRPVSALAIRHLYFEPQFTSTYRLAQFVTTVTHNVELAHYVKVLDLSHITCSTRKGTGEPLAGWRDWKLRTEPLYSIAGSHGSPGTAAHYNVSHLPPQRTLSPGTDTAPEGASPPQRPLHESRPSKRGGLRRYSKSSHSSTDLQELDGSTAKGKRKLLPGHTNTSSSNHHAIPSSSTVPKPTHVATPPPPPPFKHASSPHPVQSFLLRQFTNSRDVPLGALLHLLKVCHNLLIVDLSRLPLATDYFINETPSMMLSTTRYPTPLRKFPITSASGYIFVSDVARPRAFPQHALKQVSISQLMDAIAGLRFLTTLNLGRATWLSKELVNRFLDTAESVQFTQTLHSLDFRDSGLARDLEWAIQGTPEEVKAAASPKE